MMEPMLDRFEKLVGEIPVSAPTVPYIATLTGLWADGPVTDPGYWSAQIRSTVRFADGLRTLLGPDGPVTADPVLLEVGPGRALISAAMSNNAAPGSRLLASLPAADDGTPDTALISTSLGRLWEHGVEVDWPGFHKTERRRRVSLPTYPFERQSYWIGRPNAPGGADTTGPRHCTDWFSRPVWNASPTSEAEAREMTGEPVLVLDEETGVGERIAEALRAAGAVPVTVRRGDRFERMSNVEYQLNPTDEAGIGELIADVCGMLGAVLICRILFGT